MKRHIVLCGSYVMTMAISGWAALISFESDSISEFFSLATNPTVYFNTSIGFVLGAIVGLCTSTVLFAIMWSTRLTISIPAVSCSAIAAAAIHAQYISGVGYELPFTAGSTVGAALCAALLCRIIAPYRPSQTSRPGFCPECAYDLRGDLDAGCPECGWNRE